MSTAVKAVEVRFAYLLLRYLHANTQNAYLLLAIISWARAEGGGYLDPLNLRSGSFASIDAAARATAKVLLTQDAYRTIVAAARRGTDTVKEQQTQGLDFLYALTLSRWDASHYGASHKIAGPYGGWQWSEPDLAKSSLIGIWMGLLGSKITIPADVLPQPKQPPPPKPPRQADRRIPTPQQLSYIDGYAARGFLDERWKPLDPMRA